jgi:hypothetical protein
MKGNMKKLVVLVVVATIATFISAALALCCDKDFDRDFHHGRKTIHGVYAATSVGSCISTPYGFNENLTPKNPPDKPVSSNTATSQIIWTFNRDGTGTADAMGVGISLSPNQSGGLSHTTWQFTYDVTDDGMVTIHTVSGGSEYLAGPLKGATYTIVEGVDESGYISEDHKTITLGMGMVVGVIKLRFTGFDIYAICNYSRVLIRVGE